MAHLEHENPFGIQMRSLVGLIDPNQELAPLDNLILQVLPLILSQTIVCFFDGVQPLLLDFGWVLVHSEEGGFGQTVLLPARLEFQEAQVVAYVAGCPRELGF
jgi:hypothetical protein